MTLHIVICVYNSQVKFEILSGMLFTLTYGILGYHSELEGYVSSDDELDDSEV